MVLRDLNNCHFNLAWRNKITKFDCRLQFNGDNNWVINEVIKTFFSPITSNRNMYCTCTTTIVHNKHYVIMTVSEISILKGQCHGLSASIGMNQIYLYGLNIAAKIHLKIGAYRWNFCI